MSRVKSVAAAAAGLLAAGVAVTGVGALPQADASAGTSSSAASSTTLHCHPAKQLPAKLRADLRAARALPAGSRGPALRKVRESALRGAYGDRAERWAERRLVHRAQARAQLPERMRQDLRAVHQLPAAQRPAARRAVRARALHGGYGAAAQQRAEKVAAHRAACKAQR